MRALVLLLFSAAVPIGAEIEKCACDPAKPESMAARECSLCREAEAQPPEPPVFFLKDINPTKPNRWLALPRAHASGDHLLSGMTLAQRLQLWTAAIAKAQSLWGDDWGLAVNATRTQCHTHIHIGKLMRGIETRHFIIVDGPAGIPLPKGDTGLWIHPSGRKLHVHLDERITETVLVR